MLSSLLIADLHLVTGEIEKTQLFIKFCRQHASKADQLFILGDLFNTWLGDDLSLGRYPTVIKALKQLSLTTKIFIMAGNRDFLIGSDFEQQSGAQLINEPYLLEVNNQKYILIHGDSLCTDDANYQKLKKVLRNPVTIFIFTHLSKKMRLRLSGQLRKKSVEAQQVKSYNIMDVNQSSVDRLMQKYPNTHLIHGHTHRQNTHIGEHYTRYVLGDWANEQGNAISINTKLNWLKVN